MISEHTSDDIPPQMKILNMVIPIVMHFCSFISNLSVASRIKPHKGIHHQMKCDVINDIKLFPTVFRRIYCCNFFSCYPIKHCVTKASALECWQSEMLVRIANREDQTASS